MMVPCMYRNAVRGKFAVDCTDPLTALMGRLALRENLVAMEDRSNASAHLATKDKFVDWCQERGICIRNIYSGFFTAIPTSFLERDILFAVEFQTPHDAMLFRLSWIN